MARHRIPSTLCNTLSYFRIHSFGPYRRLLNKEGNADFFECNYDIIGKCLGGVNAPSKPRPRDWTLYVEREKVVIRPPVNLLLIWF